MTVLLLPWLELAACAALIGLAGPALTRYGDQLAKLTDLSRSWIGLVLIATATSLPELFTGISAVTAADAPNIAVGDALGSCVFNLVMLVLLDELSRNEPVYRRIDQGHILTAGFGVILIGAAGAFLLLSQSALEFPLLHISGYTPFIIAIYLVAMRAALTYQKRARPTAELVEAGRSLSLRSTAVMSLAPSGSLRGHGRSLGCLTHRKGVLHRRARLMHCRRRTPMHIRYNSRLPAMLALAAIFGLSACATEPAAYAPKTPGATTGYTDQQLTSDRYRVTFTGNSATDRQRVEDYLLLRSAQITINADRNWFMFDTRSTQAKTTYMSTFTGWRGWHGYGWYWHNWAWGSPYTATSRPITRYHAYAEIVLLSDAQAKDTPHAIDAHEIVQHLQPIAAPAERSGPAE